MIRQGGSQTRVTREGVSELCVVVLDVYCQISLVSQIYSIREILHYPVLLAKSSTWREQLLIIK